MQSTQGLMIPKRIKYLSESELPHDYSKTPGGTLYGTTPGGTRIIYELDHMMRLKNSPHAKTPPKNLPFIPGVTKGIEFNRTSPLMINDLNNNKISAKPKIVEERAETDFELEL